MSQYGDTLHPEIFSAAQGILIKHSKYPERIQKFDYGAGM
jgi:hypothetical protein